MLPWVLAAIAFAGVVLCLKTLSEKEGDAQFYKQEAEKFQLLFLTKSNEWWQLKTNFDALNERLAHPPKGQQNRLPKPKNTVQPGTLAPSTNQEPIRRILGQ